MSDLPKKLHDLFKRPKHKLDQETVCLEEIVRYRHLKGLTNLYRGSGVEMSLPVPWNNIPKLLIEVIWHNLGIKLGSPGEMTELESLFRINN